MNIHSFTADTIQQALEEVRHTLGPDAIVLSTASSIHEPQLSRGLQLRTVIVKACRPEDLPRKPREEKACQPNTKETVTAQTVANIESAASYIEQLYQQEQKTLLAEHQQMQQQRQQHPEKFVSDEIVLPLLDAGVELEFVRELLRTISQDVPEHEIAANIQKQLKYLIPRVELDLNPVHHSTARPRVVLLTGRSGSGKSTLAAKLATQCELRDEVPVAVVEVTGTNRQQHFWLHLQMQGLGIHSVQVSSTSEIRETLEKFHSCAAIFIDTPALSANAQQLALINALLQEIPVDDCILTHDVHMRAQATIEIARELHSSCQFSVALTKTDEQDSLGHLVSLFQQIRLPVTLLSHSAALADGFSHVSEDIQNKLIQRITGLEVEERPDSRTTTAYESSQHLERQEHDSFTLNLDPM